MSDYAFQTRPLQGARRGTVLDGKYSVVQLLGEGGMGEVYEARHLRIGRRVAVKFLHGELACDPDIARRFENEARAAGEVEHENIAAIYDVGALPDGTRYLVMEFLDGEDLEHVLRRELRFPLRRAADLMMQSCQGLDVVHRRGIVHRDLKPANLFLTRRANGTDLVKILDFGIAKLRHPGGHASMTATGVAIGTPCYMSPEQARGERDVGARSDVYALGVILYELLSGRRPHRGESALQIVNQILTQPPVPLEEVCPGLPGAVYPVVRKAMAASDADRFGSVRELAEALAPFAGEVYRPSELAPMGATRIETADGVRLGNERASRSGGGGQSVGAVARSAAPTRRRGTSLALVASSMLLVGMGIGALLWTHGRAATSPVPAAVSITAASPLVSPSASAISPLPAVLPVFGSEVSGRPVSGHEEVSGHSDGAAPAPEFGGEQEKGSGALLAPLANQSGVPSSAGRGSARRTKSPASGAAPGSNKPDCTQNYMIDSEGNRRFRPECFSK